MAMQIWASVQEQLDSQQEQICALYDVSELDPPPECIILEDPPEDCDTNPNDPICQGGPGGPGGPG